MRVVDIQLGFPAILVALILIAVLGKGVDKIIITRWSACNGPTSAHRALGGAGGARKEYMEAARGLGLSRSRIVLRHLLPNALRR